MDANVRRILLPALLISAFAEAAMRGLMPVLLSDGHVYPAVASLEALIGNLVAVLAAVVLFDIATQVRRTHAVVSMSLFLFAAVALVAPWFASQGGGVLTSYAALVATIVVTAGLAVSRRLSGRGWWALGWLGLTAATGHWYTLAASSASVAQLTQLNGYLEFFTLLAPVVAFFALSPFSRLSRTSVFAALSASLLFALLYAVTGAELVTAVLSFSGLSMTLPVWVYCLSGYFFVATAFSLVEASGKRVQGLAVALFFLAGTTMMGGGSVLLSVLALTLLALALEPRRSAFAEREGRAGEGSGPVPSQALIRPPS